MTIKKKIIVLIVFFFILGVYVFGIKPHFFQGELSKEMVKSANTEFSTIIDSVSENDVLEPNEIIEDSNLESADELSNDTGEIDKTDHPDESTIAEPAEVISEGDPSDSDTQKQAYTTPVDANKVPTPEEKKQKIEAKYIDGMGKIEQKAEQLLGQLIGEARLEYSALSAEQKKSLSVTGQMASNYMARARSLEKLVDKAVDELLGKMSNELTEANLSTEVVKSLRSEYEVQKKARQKELLNKALGYQP